MFSMIYAVLFHLLLLGLRCLPTDQHSAFTCYMMLRIIVADKIQFLSAFKFQNGIKVPIAYTTIRILQLLCAALMISYRLVNRQK
jgi:hypothetical protein